MVQSAASFSDVFTKVPRVSVMSIGCAGRARRSRYVVMHLRHNAGTPRLFIGRNNGDSPGTVLVYFIMLYILGSGVDKKVTNLPPSRFTRRRRAMHNHRCENSLPFEALWRRRE